MVFFRRGLRPGRQNTLYFLLTAKRVIPIISSGGNNDENSQRTHW